MLLLPIFVYQIHVVKPVEGNKSNSRKALTLTTSTKINKADLAKILNYIQKYDN